MPQPPVVMAFRARLVTSGYTDISITRFRKDNNQQIYRVIAVEPLAGIPIVRDMDMQEMFCWR